MKKTFTIKLNTEFIIDFTSWGLSDAEQRGGDESRKLIIGHYLEQCGMDEFEISVGTGRDLSLQKRNGSSLFETMAEVVQAKNECLLRHKKEFENSIERT